MNISKNISKADRNAYAAALELSNDMAAYWKELLGKNLLGFYLLGSLAHGGFNRRYSDIDLGLVAEIPLTDAMLDTMRSHARSLTPELADKISLFWADRSLPWDGSPLWIGSIFSIIHWH